MTGTALGANTENIIFISEAHEKFYYEKLKEVRFGKTEMLKCSLVIIEVKIV